MDKLYGRAAQQEAFENIMNGSDEIAKRWLTEYLQKHSPNSDLLKTAAGDVLKEVPQPDTRSTSDKVNEQRKKLGIK